MNKYISKVITSCLKTFITLTILLSLSAGFGSAAASHTSIFHKYQGRFNNIVVFAADNVQPDAVSSPSKEAEAEKKAPSNSKNTRYIIIIVLLLGFSAVALRSLISKKE